MLPVESEHRYRMLAKNRELLIPHTLHYRLGAASTWIGITLASTGK